MKLLDKLKNALFEEEYVEMEEKPKKKEIKKQKRKREEQKAKEKPIAKKIVQPERKEIIEEGPELLDEDFKIPEKNKNDFKFPVMEDKDFKIEEEPREKLKKKEEPVKKEKRKPENKSSHEKKLKPYGLDEFDIPEKEHGLYEKKEERSYFKPSPIISPIYGILDKNYKKEEIRDRKEVRLTSSYAHENLDLDEVRKRAYGNLTSDIEKEFKENREPVNIISYEDDEEEDGSSLLDLSTDTDTPEVKKVTVGDAEEYFEDLGLEYNVDYKDTSKEKATGRRTNKNYEEELASKQEDQDKNQNNVETKGSMEEDLDDDNLFDLIDSMYDKD
ncbi:MAG: hypothetical protein HFJ12_02785 [Bacilli bacterium]|nr:hypothetical protein [Bacilli bacterium]